MGRFVTWQKFDGVVEEPAGLSIRAVSTTHALTVLTTAIVTHLAFGLLSCLGDEGSVCDVNEIFSLFWCCAVSNSSYLLTVRDNLSVSFSRIKLSMIFTLEVGTDKFSRNVSN
jgi:hypothetical protein